MPHHMRDDVAGVCWMTWQPCGGVNRHVTRRSVPTPPHNLGIQGPPSLVNPNPTNHRPAPVHAALFEWVNEPAVTASPRVFLSNHGQFHIHVAPSEWLNKPLVTKHRHNANVPGAGTIVPVTRRAPIHGSRFQNEHNHVALAVW